MNNVAKTCWICGKPATTGEHKQKKTDVTAMFGAGPYKERKVVKIDFNNSKKSYLQSPNSKALKYNTNLCAKCNNQITQPYDKAYEEFADYIRKNFNQMKKKGIISTKLIFGKNRAKKQQDNLFRYFIKAFGCQLDEKGLNVPIELIDALKGKNYGKNFRISICINYKCEGYLQNFPIEGDKDQNEKPVDFFWAQQTGCFTVVYAYNRAIPREFGEEWYGKSKKIVTGNLTSSNNAFTAGG